MGEAERVKEEKASATAASVLFPWAQNGCHRPTSNFRPSFTARTTGSREQSGTETFTMARKDQASSIGIGSLLVSSDLYYTKRVQILKCLINIL